MKRQPRLVALSGPLKGEVFFITGIPISFGRAEDNTVVLDDELVSGSHFKTFLNDGKPCVRDGDTRNGTWINGVARSERYLEDGDRIKCGSTTFLYLEFDKDPKA